MKYRLCKALCKVPAVQYPTVVDGQPKWECRGCGAVTVRRTVISAKRKEMLASLEDQINKIAATN